MWSLTLPPLVFAAAALTHSTAGPGDPTKSQTYRVRQTVTLSEVPAGAKTVRWWISIPGDDRAQEVLDMSVVSAPGKWSIEREAEHGNRFLYVEVRKPKGTSLETVVEFTLRRRSLHAEIDPKKVGVLSAEQKALFVDELRLDAPHMEVTTEMRELANKVAGDETNLAIQAKKLLDFVMGAADHYSKDSTKPKCSPGDAGACLSLGGGCCTDMHSLFIALARAREIPTRLQMGYRLLPKNVGKEVDPGYRCWAEYYLPGYGWVAADLVEADAVEGDARQAWLTGLTERRLWLNQGREFILTPKQAGPRVNTMVIGYAEIDGKAARVLPEGEKAAQLSRKVHFIEVADQESAALKVSMK